MSAPSTPPPTQTSHNSNQRPASPSPSRSGFRALARMGTMLRRNSTDIRRGLSRSASKTSLHKETMAAPEDAHPAPSPVAESPDREAEANAIEAATSKQLAHQRSPLAHEAKETPDPSPVVTSPPILTNGPGPLTESPPPLQPTELPSSSVASPTPAVPVPAQEPTTKKEVVVISPGAEVTMSPETVLETFEQQTASKKPSVEDVTSAPTPPPADTERADYFAWSHMPAKKPSVASIDAHEPVPVSAPAPAGPLVEVKIVNEQRHFDPYEEASADRFAWKDDAIRAASPPSSRAQSKAPSRVHSRDQLVGSPESMPRSMSKSPSREQLVASPRSATLSLSPKASRSSLASSYGQVVNISSGGRQVSISVDPSAERRGRSRSRAGSIRSVGGSRAGRSLPGLTSTSATNSSSVSLNDPFADPPTAAHASADPSAKYALSPIYSVNSPELENPKTPEMQPSFPEPEPDTHARDSPSPSPVVHMPLPALNEVSNSRSIRQVPSSYSVGTSSVAMPEPAPHVVDERLPLLGKMPVPTLGKSKATPEPPTFNDYNANVPPRGAIAWPTIEHTYRSLGWAEYILPDNSTYFANVELRVTTDVDLRNNRKLEVITDLLDRKRPGETTLPPVGWELWLREAGEAPYESMFVKSWISHRDRIVTTEPPTVGDNGQPEPSVPLSEDDRLDMEFRYWSFLENHPAHLPLSPSAHAEALDTLTWCYTDCLLPSQQDTPPPFAPQECQELMSLLRGFNPDNPSNRVVHTRIVARVLLRLAQWRQHYFRPNRPLPTDGTKTRPQRRTPVGRYLLNAFMSVFCLGIPYLFMGRTSHRRIDEESGIRNHGAILVIGTCACLMAAVILSASVTLLTLPGLDDIARLAGMIAILFSASSMISAVVALFKYKAGLERTVVFVGGEGLMVMSRRSIVMSLPVVFLAWGIAAFVTGITFYSFRGVTLASKVVVREPFVDYTHWTVVGSLGGMFGIVLVAALVGR